MRQDPLLASIGGMLRRFKRAEAWLRNAGLPTSLARVPVWLLCMHYCLMMRGKTARITRIAERIARWLETITELAQHESARTELIDMDGGMRNDIESTKRTLLLLRELCVDVGGMFRSTGFKSRFLEHTQETFMAVADESFMTATTLQRAIEMHDTRALSLLREMEEAERASGTVVDSAPEAAMDEVVDGVVGPANGPATALPPGVATDMPSGPESQRDASQSVAKRVVTPVQA
ncbi:hypothetical protein GJV26_05165 [Massilia dura]|uniref:Uncharacterized protein n=1 Tax=Pseudoduganella dura TaxID=321982 RepID=A0A6I3X6I7_9BURK|nr:hypothetical protein [Pseudoduganella dura]MUI11877.1 hypothetical protein [Pseudoduganella dura]GGY08956.1 hypothetical protein GCM10007386_44330 [Pseudoduganella dura]